MKQLLSLSAVFLCLLMLNCERIKDKLDKKDIPCSVVSEETVPQNAKDVLYGATVINENGDTTTIAGYAPTEIYAWFNTDNTGYCVSFLSGSGVETKLFFDNAGQLLKEEIDVKDDNDNEEDDENDEEDDDDNEEGCVCELDDDSENED